MNKEEQPRPQVEDVWEHRKESTRCTITAVGKKYCLYDINGETWDDIDNFTRRFFLIERDGKPYKPKRVLEKGAYYAVIFEKYEEENIARYDGEKFSLTGWSRTFNEDSLIIGDKLEIKFPEVEE